MPEELPTPGADETTEVAEEQEKQEEAAEPGLLERFTSFTSQLLQQATDLLLEEVLHQERVDVWLFGSSSETDSSQTPNSWQINGALP